MNSLNSFELIAQEEFNLCLHISPNNRNIIRQAGFAVEFLIHGLLLRYMTKNNLQQLENFGRNKVTVKRSCVEDATFNDMLSFFKNKPEFIATGSKLIQRLHVIRKELNASKRKVEEFSGSRSKEVIKQALTIFVCYETIAEVSFVFDWEKIQDQLSFSEQEKHEILTEKVNSTPQKEFTEEERKKFENLIYARWPDLKNLD